MAMPKRNPRTGRFMKAGSSARSTTRKRKRRSTGGAVRMKRNSKGQFVRKARRRR